MLLVDYSIRNGKNIPPHLTYFTTCGFFLSQRGHRAGMGFARPASPQIHEKL